MWDPEYPPSLHRLLDSLSRKARVLSDRATSLSDLTEAVSLAEIYSWIDQSGLGNKLVILVQNNPII
jgi:hypothetical protein